MPKTKTGNLIFEVKQALIRFCQRQIMAAYNQFKSEIEPIKNRQQRLKNQARQQADLKKAEAILNDIKNNKR